MSHPNNVAKYPNKPSKPSVTPSQQIQEMRDAVIALQKSDERQNKRISALMTLSALKFSVDERISSWLEAAKYIGSAYVMAYNNHKDILAKQAANDPLNIQIIFSVLTVVTAGSLSWVGLSAKLGSLGFSQLGKDIVEDAAQAGVGEVFSAVGPLVFTPSIGPVGIEPQIFQNDLEVNILSMQTEINRIFAAIIRNLQEAPPEKWDYYDAKEQVAQHDAWRKKAAQFSGKEDLPIGLDGKPNKKMMADELERGIWAKYILSERYYRDFGVFGKTSPKYEFVGVNVCKRLAELGALELTHNAMNIPESEEYIGGRAGIDSLARWANGYQPTPFVEMRRKQEKLGAAIKYFAPPALRYFGNLLGK